MALHRFTLLLAAFPFPLIAGPFRVDYATYLGGAADDTPTGIAVDATGNAYLVGTTVSPDFPITNDSFGTPAANDSCAFVTKLNSTATGIVWSVCLSYSRGQQIAVDASGSAYVLTTSLGTTPENFITKLSPDGSRIIYSKLISAIPNALAVDGHGNAYVTGSAGPDFPATSAAYQPALAPGTCYARVTSYTCSDAFVMMLHPDGSLGYATYLGGSGTDTGRAIAVDSQGNVWITGDTVSPNFPTTAGALQSQFHGEIDIGPLAFGDAFVAKLDPTGSRLLYSTYLGGTAADTGFAIAIGNAGAAYVAGGTQSTDFPTTPGVLQRNYGGGNSIPSSSGDAFITKFNSSGTLAYSTYLGGTQDEAARQIAVDAQGEAFVLLNNNALSVLNPTASAIVNSVSMPGSFALDNQSALYFANSTLGYLFFPSSGAVQSKLAGGYDASVVKIDFGGASPWIGNIVNAAGLRSGTPSFYPVFDVAPGEIVTIFGTGFDNTTNILFDGFPAPILYTRSDQINAVVPFEVTGPTTSIQLQGAGQTFGPGVENVFDAVPALFTVDGSGKGQASVLNQDGSLNSASNPAARGSIISVFLTGAGRMAPAQVDGSLTPVERPFAMPVLGVGASIGQVVFAGAAPGLVVGAVQVNVQISNSAPTGDRVPIVIYVGNFASGLSGDTTIAVR